MMRKLLGSKYFFIVLLITINLIIGFMTIGDYGESWDETRSFEYGMQSINAYRAILNPEIKVDFGIDLTRFYGPAYLMGASLIAKGVQNLFPTISAVDLWHMNNFLCLQLGLVCLYFIMCRFTKSISSISTIALMSSQPLIWGHGFINPKDIPLFAFFTASVLFGLKMLDTLEQHRFEIRKLLVTPQFYLAGIFLGITMSIRILGFFAGVIILCNLAYINFKKVLRLSYAYYGLALVVTFLTWPFLWGSPIMNLLTSISVALKFVWPGHVLFNGAFYQPDQLPRIYFPQLFLMQLTETALLLFFIGLLLLLLPIGREKYNKLLILILPWFAFPVVYISVVGMKLYDNLRHLLFLYPAVFLIIAVGVENIFNQIKGPWLKAVLVSLVLFPGVAGIIQYHPFEYAYYNTAASSTKTIFRNFEIDYWLTSYKQASLWLNENAPQNAIVIVWGPEHIVQHYVRKDIQVKRIMDNYQLEDIGINETLKDIKVSDVDYYIVLPTQYNVDQHILPNIDPVFSIERQGSVYCVIKYLDVQNLAMKDE
jgi:hypothetical protein